MESALIERPRPGKERKLDGKQEAHLIAVACSNPPQGHSYWTLQLLVNEVVELKFADSISLESVRQILKKRTQTLEEERVVHPKGERGVRGPNGRCAGLV